MAMIAPGSVHAPVDAGTTSLPHRRVHGSLPRTDTTTWTPSLPEFSAVANGLSLLMPALEPYVLRAVKRGAAHENVSPELRATASEFVAQEAAHHQQHRAFNDELVAQVPALRFVERAEKRLFRLIERRTSAAFGLAYAAGAEAVAFFTARWIDGRHRTLLADAHGDAARLFVWHLAEEVEHKTVAFDVFKANGGRRRSYVLGIICALMMMAMSIVAGSAVLLVHEGRWWRPITHLRMIGWSLSFVMEVLPVLGLCLSRDHHPSNWHDPEWLASWLRAFDSTGTSPAWTQDTLDGIYPTTLAA
jgi:uncharacterized protein